MSSIAKGIMLLALAAACARARPSTGSGPSMMTSMVARGPADPPPPCTEWPQSCPGTFPRAPYKQTWLMNLSTIIMPCNNTGYTDPKSTKGWGIVDFDWSNGKGTGTADGWAKHKVRLQVYYFASFSCLPRRVCVCV